MIDPEKVTCPVCKEGVMVPSVIGETEIWICETCPCVLFTYYNDSDIENLKKQLAD